MTKNNTPKPNQQVCPERVQASRRIPALRFKEFTDEWQEKKLGDILNDFKLGGNYENSEVPNQFPLIKMGNLGRGGIVLTKVEYIKNGKDLDGRDLIKDGDLFFNTRNTLELVGKVAIWKNELPRAYFNSNLMRLHFDCNHYMNYYLNSYKGLKSLKRLATGTTSVAAIYTRDLLQVKLFCPVPREQEKIADFLNSVDEKINKLEAKKKAFEKYKKGVMQAIFSQKIRFKKPDGSNCQDWREKELGELFNDRSERKGDRTLELLSVTTNSGITKQTSSNKRDSSSADTSNYKIVKAGDIVYNTMRMWQGASGVSEFDGFVSPAYTVVNLIRGHVGFYKFLFKQPRVVFDFFRYSQGLTSDTWNLKFHHFSKVSVKVPSDIAEQEKIADFLTVLDNKINLINNQLEQAKLFKKALLQQMFV